MLLKSLRLLALCLLLSFIANAASVEYTLRFPEPQTHYVEVDMKIQGWKGGTMDLRMPVWTPGSYMVREFSRHLESIKISGPEGRSINYTRSAKNGWKVNVPAGNVVISYSVYAFELTVRTSFIDADHAYLNGTSIFLYAEGGKDWPVIVNVVPHDSWKTISVALEQAGGKNSFRAPDYDVLVDSPFEIGNHRVLNFSASGVEHTVAMYGEGNYDSEKLIKDMKRIVEECTSIFGSHPCKEYLFIIHNLNSGGGGLEHLNSTTLQTSRFSYGTESSYTGFLSLVAHEYLHLWNVKRLRPAELGPFDYNSENYTRMLWLSEGFTAYYDDLIVRRCGFATPESYLSTLAGNFSYVENTPGSRYQSLEESSYDAWIKYYRPHENSSNSTVSYYTKGAVAGALLDLAIRNASNGTRSLDDVMRKMYEKHYLANNGQAGFTEKDFRSMVASVSGRNMDDFFTRYIAGTDSMPVGTFLAYAGLKISDQPSSSLKPVWTGITVSGKEGRQIITAVERNSPAWKSGLNVNDELLAVNNYRITDDFQKLVSQMPAGEVLTITLSRSGMLRNIQVKPVKAPQVRYSIEQDPAAAESAAGIFRQWLKIAAK